MELGTGVRTALAQIVAEELDAFGAGADGDGRYGPTPDEGYTAGSMTISSSGTVLRLAAAEARCVPCSKWPRNRLDAGLHELSVRDSAITVAHDPARSLTYAELMGGKLRSSSDGLAPRKPPESYQIVGTSTPRDSCPAR